MLCTHVEGCDERGRPDCAVAVGRLGGEVSERLDGQNEPRHGEGGDDVGDVRGRDDDRENPQEGQD